MGAEIGFVCCAIAILGFGSNFVVIKKYDPGDGVFFQLNMCIAVWISGLVFHLYLGAPPIQPVAMLGGVLWAIGNVTVPFIVETIGLALGMLIWGTMNMLTGWASGHFGILGVTKETVPNNMLNVAGVIVTIFALGIYGLVEPNSSDDDEKKASINGGQASVTDGLLGAGPVLGKDKKKLSDGMSPGAKRTAGVLVALGAGVLFGACFNPAQYVSDQAKLNHCSVVETEAKCSAVRVPGVGLVGEVYCLWDAKTSTCGGMPIQDMAFSQFCGILFTAFAIFVVYAIYNRNDVHVTVPLIFPGFISGIVWAIAQISWFVASQNLSMAVSFPLIATGPGIVSALWGVLVFTEISGKANIMKLVVAILVAASADVMITLSKIAK